jgi:hypothetical protein
VSCVKNLADSLSVCESLSLSSLSGHEPFLLVLLMLLLGFPTLAREIAC